MKKLFFGICMLFALQSHSQDAMQEPSRLQTKFAVLLDTAAEAVTDTLLYSNVEKWIGTRYQRGGVTTRGVDCSGLTKQLYMSVFGKDIPRVSWQQYNASVRISKLQLKRGDLVFFRIGKTWHVGMYLQNDRFVHAARTAGVTVNSLNGSYWKKYVYGYGKME